MNLEDLGYSDWHGRKLEGREREGDELEGRGTDEARIARIAAVDRDRCLIAGPFGSVPAAVSGRLLYCSDSLEDLPCVGDWVLVDYVDGHQHAVIYEALPRRTVLRRRAPGGSAVYQPIASNIDVAYIVQSCDVDFSLNRLDRYLVMAADGGITSKLLLTKCDLITRDEVDHLVAEVKKDHGIEVAALSSATGAGYDQFTHSLERGMTYCLLGSSGVGKSSILNRLLGTEMLATSAVREKSGKGRHTTTRRQLIALESGALFVDTPGMRELGMLAFGAGLEEGYRDIAAAAAECRYADCTHTSEKGCAVLAQVDTGQLSRERYESYLKLTRESEHYEMTSLEKRRKDRAFGKMLKDYERFNKRRSLNDEV